MVKIIRRGAQKSLVNELLVNKNLVNKTSRQSLFGFGQTQAPKKSVLLKQMYVDAQFS